MAGLFEFSSGGAYNPQGFGAWAIRLEKGMLGIMHNVNGETKDYGKFKPGKKELETVERLIKTSNLEVTKSSSRSGIPDEARMFFAVNNRKIEIWVEDARENVKLAELVNYIGKLIEKYAKVKPVLW